MNDFQESKAIVADYFRDMEAADSSTIGAVLEGYCSEDCQWFGSYPFREQQGTESITNVFWQPLYESFQGLQRRQDIFMAGENEIHGEQWVMSMGHFLGLFDYDWLGIPASRKIVMLRYAEFNCVENGKITKTGLFCDIIGLMHQVGINPLPIQTGASFVYPGPRHHDGLLFESQPEAQSEETLQLVNRMIQDLDLLNISGEDKCPPEYLAKTWSEDMLWYGPAGIGATYTIPRYQEQHQHPFRAGLTDKVYNGHYCRFAEGNFACFFGWPNLSNRSKGGFMGLPEGKRADMQVVDVYRREGDKLVENWVLIDLPYWLAQQGVDILERTRGIVNPN
ncbi:MAG: nuclear transport factor 2 family protein [Halioglobus sp.]